MLYSAVLRGINEEHWGNALNEIFGPDGALALCLDHYEPRSGQIAMAEAVEGVLSFDEERQSPENNGRVLVVEAETGIGKTLAYLVPALLSGKRIVVSTATLNLQDQIINKDIPLLQTALGEKLPVLCLKGRENYLCLYRWYQFRSQPQLSFIEDPWIGKIDTWLAGTRTGDRAELDWLGEKNSLWTKISSHSNHCLGGDCPESTECYLNHVRKKAGAARLLIVNHHLFFSDLALKKTGYGDLLPRYEAVIFDEAHHLENVATNFFGKNFSHYQLFDVLGDVERHVASDVPAGDVDLLLPKISGLRQRVEWFFRLFPAKQGRYHLQPLLKGLGVEEWQKEVDVLLYGINGLADQLHSLAKYGDEWSGYGKRLEELGARLRDIALPAADTDHRFVYWYERRERSVQLSASPIEVASLLQENLYSQVEACVLTSATLSSGGSFSYIKDRLGLDEEVEYLKLESPFDYRGRTLLYIPEESFPEPSHNGFTDSVCERVLKMLVFSRGRALVLCTSFKGMEAIAEYLEERLNYPVLVQGRGSRNSLLESFRGQTESVLLAVASFWEGVDIVGESLSCVIIDKLPFEVPSDPVIQARIERIQADGGKPFFQFQVPRAILTLRQGVGRLMRSVNDRGVIAIMDIRLFSKGYGRTFLKSMPPSPVTRNVDEFELFFRDPAVEQELIRNIS